MSEKYYLIVDIGTGNSRAALVSQDNDVMDIEAFENEYCRDPLYDDAQYFEPEKWKERLFSCIKTLMSRHSDAEILGISCDGARQSIVCFNEAEECFIGLPNIDNRAKKWMNEIPYKDRIYQKTGRWVTEDFPAAKLMGFRKKHPDEFKAIRKITSLSEWVGWLFTGEIVVEPSQACEIQLYDTEEKIWSEHICEIYGIDVNILPPLVPAGSSLGKIKPEVASALGITESAEFIVGGADTQVAAESTGVDVGDVCIVSGTTSPVIRLSAERYVDDLERCWTNCNLGGDTFVIETNPGVTGNNYQRFKNTFCPDVSYRDLDWMMGERKDFICTCALTSLNFEAKKGWKNGGFIMRPPFAANFNRIDLCYALVGDIACSIYQQYLSLCAMMGHHKDYILGCGGGFRSSVMSQMISDLTGKKLILRPGYVMASVLGCVSVCNKHFGYIPAKTESAEATIYYPNNDNDVLIKRYYRKWKENREALNK